MSPNLATQQMNIRIDSFLKSEGDAVFASIGLTSSQAIRALYQAAVQYRYDTTPLSSFLSGNSDTPGNPCLQNEKLEAANRGRIAFAASAAKLGITLDSLGTCSEMPYDELLEEAHYERLVERGLQ